MDWSSIHREGIRIDDPDLWNGPFPAILEQIALPDLDCLAGVGWDVFSSGGHTSRRRAGPISGRSMATRLEIRRADGVAGGLV